MKIAGKLIVFPAMTLAFVFMTVLGGGAAGAQSANMALTIQVGSAGSQPTGVSCAELSVGQMFPVDVRIENAENLTAYELRVTYDSSVVSLEEADFEHFLVSTPPYGQIFPSLFEAETANSYFLAAAETRASPDSGSGVLARLQMKAIGEGMSVIGIQTDPDVYGPRLTNNKGQPIGDGSGDRIFDGTVQSGLAAVGESCSGGTIEEPPVSGGGDPGPGNPPDDGAGSNDGDGGSSGDRPAGVVVGGASQDPDPADAGDNGTVNDAGTADGDGDAAADGPDGDGIADGGDGDPGGPEGAGSASTAGSGGNSGLSVLWYVLIGVGAVAVLGVLGLAVKSVRTR